MLRRCVPLLTFAMLSGCTLTQSTNHEKTMNAINTMEERVNYQFATMIQQIDEQNEYIANLEKELSSISEELSHPPMLVTAATAKSAEDGEKAVTVIEPAIDTKVAHGKVILGEEEWVWLDSIQSFFKARIDTGATTSSLNAVDIQIFERDGKEWARFNLNHTFDGNEEKAEIVEAPVVRWVKVRQSTSEQSERRPVIEAWVKLGLLHEKAQFTLADRSQMTYPILLGREFFKDIALVDVGKKFVQGMNEQEVQTINN
ncbi:ATP-dependent zinc protease family protein [Photobacterium chitinilyticum]|uniref:ATP-dependent zinc protease n=1 Tax=Photobacterium chitinilyticum TaxID=2485123 RepID=A0A3S3R0V3_9GAMM|nr:ATP-dependent zinc protease [Photobacterium chitinilyticum]RWX55261.1 ATP-dependent zinc protease [Photobacterium chitinilyticum]